MSVYRRNSMGYASGDTIPFYHDGVYHLFYLSNPIGSLRYPERCRNTWQHAMSRNLTDWEECPPVLKPGEGTELDEDGCWTGSVIFADGMYHIFYTAYQINSHNPQKICHATSHDCITWTKDTKNPIVPDETMYENIDWRDPYIFYNDEDDCYWMLIAARKNSGPNNRRGVVVLYKSKDLVNFEHYGPLYEPWHTNCPECPEMFKLGDYWYLVYSRYSERGQTLYRYSKSPYGPWRTPKMDGIDCRRFYAAKSMEDVNGRRFFFAWIPEREGFSDDNQWQTGGDFGIPHEVKSMPNGDLKVFMPEEVYALYNNKKLSFSYEPKLGRSELYGDKSIVLNSIGTLSNGYFRPEEKDFMFECDIKANDCGDYFGFCLKTDDDMDEGFLLAFEMAGQRVYLNKIPGELDPFWADLTGAEIVKCEVDGPRPCEKPFVFKNGDYIHVKIVMTGSLIEIFIDDSVVFSYRSYRETGNTIGIFAQDCNIEYLNIKFTKE